MRFLQATFQGLPADQVGEEISNIKKKKRLPYYFINEYFLQKQLFLVQRLVWVAGWLWRLHKLSTCWLRRFLRRTDKRPFLIY
jgi:hypothetical protein